MAPVAPRPYTSTPGFSEDFHRVREFLLRHNYGSLRTPNFPWGRWEWIFCRNHQDTSALGHIGIWEVGGEIVALVTYEDVPGEAFFVVNPGYEDLKPAMLEHAETHMARDGALRVLIDDHDEAMQRIALARGYRSTQETQPTSVMHAAAQLSFTPPADFRVVSTAQEFDVRRFNRCLHRGFNHEGEPDESEAELASRWQQVSGPHQNRAYGHVVIAPNGDYAAYCGMWYQPGEVAALVEPVCTDPTYRMLGCGRAAVLASVQACFDASAPMAIVGSSQQFYYKIGFAPVYNTHYWER